MFWIPMAIGAATGALTNKDNPLKGAALGGTLGAVTGGLGGLGGLGGETAAAISGAATPTATAAETVNGAITGAGSGSGLGLSLTPAQALGQGPFNLSGMGGGQGLLSGKGAEAAGMGGAQGIGPGGAATPAAGGLLSPGGMQAFTDMAGLAQKAGAFDSPQVPQAQSAGIPARQPDFTGLLSAGREQMTGAQRLMQQRAARRM